MEGTELIVFQNSNAMTIGSDGELDRFRSQVGQDCLEVGMHAVLTGAEIHRAYGQAFHHCLHLIQRETIRASWIAVAEGAGEMCIRDRAIAVKLLPVVLLPLYWKRVRIRDAALATAVVGLLYVPFLNHGRIPVGSLGTYVQNFRFNGPVFAALDRFAPPQILAGLAVLAGLATATWLRIRSAKPGWSPEQFASMFAWPMAASLLCAPAVFPWYLLWLLPFLTSASTLLIIVWTVSIIPVYVQWHLRTLGRPWGALHGWVMLIEYGCVAMAAATIVWRRSRSATLQNPSGLAE